MTVTKEYAVVSEIDGDRFTLHKCSNDFMSFLPEYAVFPTRRIARIYRQRAKGMYDLGRNGKLVIEPRRKIKP